jgi:hypothetical protein
MRKLLFTAVIIPLLVPTFAWAQADYQYQDGSNSTYTIIDNSTETDSTVNSTNTNTNTNTNTSTNTNANTNTNTSTSTVNSTSESSVDQNVNQTNTNTNTNTSTSNSTSKSDVSTNNVNTNRNDSKTEIESPPPSAISPNIGSSYSQDLCTTGASMAVQTQILGISGGKAVRDMNCERIKLSKTLYDMGMKVAAVSTMCQDERVWKAMLMAGTPCPFEGKIGSDALKLWAQYPELIPNNGLDEVKIKEDLENDNTSTYVLGGALLLLLLL